MKYIGTQWYKCDFHLHTTASKCFNNRDVTPNQWVTKAVEMGLDCVAVTDHNNASMINEIKIEAKKQGLIVFPGVEITCDTSKVHLLAIFDKECSALDVEDFLIRCGIDRGAFGRLDACTIKSVFDIIELSKESPNPIIIPAHIDEFNGLGGFSYDALNRLKEIESIRGYQVANPILYDEDISEADKLTALQTKYGDGTVSKALFDSWKKTGEIFAKDDKCALLTFSDNPEGPNSSKHGIEGIGAKFTWVKMDEEPSLEGVRQAMLTPEFRIKNCHEAFSSPFTEPSMWFKSISIKSSFLNKEGQELKIDFSPQMNTIIGGRGSGKSSVLRFIRGVFNKATELKELEDILKEHEDFYKIFTKKDQKGVLKADTQISIEVVRHGVLYTICTSKIKSAIQQDVVITKHVDGVAELVTDAHFLDFFTFDQYSQKQIYEISKNTNTLRSYIDRAIVDIKEVDDELLSKESNYIKVSSEIRYISDLISSKQKLISEDNDLVNQLQTLESGDIKALLNEKKEFSEQVSSLRQYWKGFKESHDGLVALFDSVSLPKLEIDPSLITNEMKGIVQKSTEEFQGQIKTIEAAISAIKDIQTSMEVSIRESELLKKVEDNKNQIKAESSRLDINTDEIVGKFEQLENSRANLRSKISNINKVEVKLPDLEAELKKVKESFFNAMKERTEHRKKFLKDYVVDEKIKIDVKSFRDESDFISKFRGIIQKDTGFDDDIELLVNLVFKGPVEKNLELFKSRIKRIPDVNDGFSGKFFNMLCKLNDEQYDQIELLYPNDDIKVKYKPNEESGFKALSVSSAGQRTTAILTFILSFGDIPLLLDQPEDDLDNRLVYDLIVDRLKKAKDKRQIIVVTHNANIPVNSDSELIISMNSETKHVEKKEHGSIDRASIKKEVCDVMEGTEEAFNRRSMRYKLIS